MNNVNYDNKMTQLLSEKASSGTLPTVLLHVCCAPCLCGTIERLSALASVSLFWYNPNIIDRAEYNARLCALLDFLPRFRADSGLPLPLIEGNFDSSKYLDCVKGLESEREGGARCNVCFDMRLTQTAKVAQAMRFDYFCTTLTVSPHKNSALINEIGVSVQQRIALPDKDVAIWLYSDFCKRDGYARSIELCKKYGIYRQNYCGCGF